MWPRDKSRHMDWGQYEPRQPRRQSLSVLWNVSLCWSSQAALHWHGLCSSPTAVGLLCQRNAQQIYSWRRADIQWCLFPKAVGLLIPGQSIMDEQLNQGRHARSVICRTDCHWAATMLSEKCVPLRFCCCKEDLTLHSCIVEEDFWSYIRYITSFSCKKGSRV